MKLPFTLIAGVTLALVMAAGAAVAPAAARDVVIIGEVHDNPGHHAAQARIVAAMAPRAIVMEMLTPEQAQLITPGLRDDAEALATALEWQDSGWPDFAMYHPILTAAPGARVFGAAVPRAAARAAMQDGVAAAFGEGAALYGLDRPLPADEQARREALQMAAHCDALPEEMLPSMVAVQRLRDAVLARAVVRAMEETGGPVAVITGNGHARRDQGVPVYLERAMPGLAVHVIGQAEDDVPLAGRFDEVRSSPAPQREDPCAAFAE